MLYRNVIGSNKSQINSKHSFSITKKVAIHICINITNDKAISDSFLSLNSPLGTMTIHNLRLNNREK